jgi:hypothetical protein
VPTGGSCALDLRLPCLQECGFFFGADCPGKIVPSAGTTLGIVKPHVIVAKQAGAILAEIAASFEIKAMELFNVGKRAAGAPPHSFAAVSTAC